MTALHDFGAVVLEILETEPEWNADVLDRIAAEAHARDLATATPDGFFLRKPEHEN
jgi:hypothetical protein